MSKAEQISLTGLFTALVCAFTISFQLYIPATRGYFNIGEVMVYTAALIGGPLIGGFAGGVGSMLADVLTGYAHYAPATLVIKGVEGCLVGWLCRVKLFKDPKAWRALSLSSAFFVGFLLLAIAPYYVGEAEATLGPSAITLAGYELTLPSLTLSFALPSFIWPILAVAAFTGIAYVGLKASPELGWTVLSVAAGGILMVIGYYLYEQLFMGVAALAEVPFNTAQFLIGLLVSAPLYKSLKRALPGLF